MHVQRDRAVCADDICAHFYSYSVSQRAVAIAVVVEAVLIEAGVCVFVI